MPEPQPPAKKDSTNPKKINLDRWRSLPLGKSIAKLEAEIRHNQGRIEQLQQQNARLTQKIRSMSRKPPSPSKDPTSAKRIADRPRRKRKLSQRFWLSMVFICGCIAIFSGLIGFAVMRLLG